MVLVVKNLMTLRKDINESWHLKNTFLSLVSRCQGNDKEAISRALFYAPLYHLFKNTRIIRYYTSQQEKHSKEGQSNNDNRNNR